MRHRQSASAAGLCDEAAFRQAEKGLGGLKAAHRAGSCDLYYFDEAGFMRIPSVGYAWQETGEQLEVTSQRSVQENVLAFLGLSGHFHPFVFRGTVDTDLVIDCFETFSRGIAKETWVVIDNAPIQISEEFEDELNRWARARLAPLSLAGVLPRTELD